MHLWQLSLPSDFPQALAVLVSCHLISWPLSCPIQAVLCWGDEKGYTNTLVLKSHITGGISEAFILSVNYQAASWNTNSTQVKSNVVHTLVKSMHLGKK